MSYPAIDFLYLNEEDMIKASERGVTRFAVYGSVQATRFLIFANTQAAAEERFGYKPDNCRGSAHIYHRHQHGKTLIDKQGWVAGVQQAAEPIER